MNKRFSTLWAVFVTSMMVMVAFNLLIGNDDEAMVSAEGSAVADEYGYTWINSDDPDPKVEYDWIDITSIGTPLKTNLDSYSYGRYLYRYAIDQQIGFDFPFYGQTFSDLQVYPNGVLGFAPSTYNYALYNYGGEFPSSYVYTPPGTIAPFWDMYGAPLTDDDTSDIWVYQGETEQEEKYWICSWANIYYYYNTQNIVGSTYQVILYESGLIHINIKHSNPYNTNYLTIGIQNLEMSVGTTYSYGDLSMIHDEMAIEFKQYRSEIQYVEWSDGYGEDDDIYPAMAGQGDFDHSGKVVIWSEKGLEYMKEVDMVIGPGEENIIFRYDFGSDSFRVVQDPTRMSVLNSNFCSATPVSTDPNHKVMLEFHFDFNFNWKRIDHVGVRFIIRGTGIKTENIMLDNQFRVVSHVKIVGNLTVEDSRGRLIGKGDWIRGGDTIHFFGMHREYADEAIPIQPPDMIQIGIKDSVGVTYFGKETSDLDTYIYIDPRYSDMDFKLTFENVSFEGDESDKVEVQTLYSTGFPVQIDSDSPGLPSQLQVLPDAETNQPQNYDDDYEVFISWNDAVDQSSGVTTYYYSVNRNKDQASEDDIRSAPKSTGNNIALVENLPEGVNRIYLWAEDLVGNTGEAIFVEVIIDFSGVEFGGFYPSTGIWNTQLRPTCSIFINDTLTGVDPLTIEYEISTTDKIGLVGNWQNIPDSYATSNSLRVVVSGFFKNGVKNWIRFRAQDLAGNPYVISDSYNVWVDAESPKYSISSHSEDEFHLNPFQEVRIMIADAESGVDASSIEYRITTRGQTKWTPWKSYKDGVDGNSVEVRIAETFRRGEENYIQVRAKDLAGNPISYSKAFNLKINTYPEIVITEPSTGDQLFDDEDIIFDASESFDVDGDLLTFTWLFSSSSDDTQIVLGEVARVKTRLSKGEYTITLIIKDRVNNEVQSFMVIEVNERIDIREPEVLDRRDSDLDGMENWYEDKYKLDKLVKDANEDPDGDGFTNIQEFGDGSKYGENLTNPRDPRSRPITEFIDEGEEDTNPFSENMLALWGILVLLILVVVVTMIVVKSKKDRQVKRIKTVRNMRKIMPSVSWDQITTTAYMAPYAQGPTLAAAAGPALPSAAPTEVDPSTALPPAEQAAQEQPPADQPVQADPQPAPADPQPAPAQPQPAPFDPQPTPAPQPAQPDYQPPQ